MTECLENATISERVRLCARLHINCIKFCCVITSLFLVLILGLGFFLVPNIVEDSIWDAKILRVGTEQWDAFLETPFPFAFKIYLFEVINSREVYSGGKPVMKETGPYVYQVWKEKKNVTLNYTADEIYYQEFDKFIFDQEASGEMREDDKVTVLNIPLLNFLYKAEEETPFLSLINSQLKYIFERHRRLFLTNVTVKNLLFEGIKVCPDNCKNCGFVGRMICTRIRQQAPSTPQLKVKKNSVLFATFAYRNGSSKSYYTIKWGQINKLKAGFLLRYNNTSKLDVWGEDVYNCNNIQGITSIFPNNINSNSRFTFFVNDICRKIKVAYSNTDMIDGIKSYKYVSEKTSFSNSLAENRCYCINQTKNFNGTVGCLYDGVLDLAKCQGAPILLSFPHFLYADDRYVNNVEGMEPNELKHETFVTLEPISGIPIQVAKRAQFSMFLKTFRGIKMTHKVANHLIPMFWIEESMILPPEYRNLLKKQIYTGLLIIDIVKYTAISIALAIIIVCILLFVYAN